MGDARYPHPACLRLDAPAHTHPMQRLKNKLLLYFQNRSKSNGGECEIRDTDCSRGLILIHFREEAARDRVVQKERHVIKLPNQEEVHLRVSLPGDPNTGRGALRPPDSWPPAQAEDEGDEASQISSSLVLIENLQDHHSTEMLNLLLENLSEKSEDTDFNLERIPEIQSAVVTFMCDIDVAQFIRRFSSNPRVLHTKLRARRMEESCSVRVENVAGDTSEDHLAAFFENPKHGGGRVTDIVMLPEEGAALITFQDPTDVGRVLVKELVLANQKLAVFPHYPMFGITLYGKQGPCMDFPQSLDFPISPYILQYICNNGELKDNMDARMKDKHCEIQWPHQDCQNPVLHLALPPALATHLRTLAKIVPNWSKDVFQEFSAFISKFSVIEYNVDPSVWEAMREHVTDYDKVLIKPDFGSEKVFMAGMAKDVARVNPTFRQLVKETRERVERQKDVKTETLAMSPSFYHILCNSGLKEKIRDQVPQLKMDYDGPTKRTRLCGLRDEVLTAKCEILNIKQQLKSKSLEMNPHLIHFLTSADNEDLSCLLFVRHNINAMLEIDDGDVRLIAFSKQDLTAAQKQMEDNLLHRQLLVEDKSLLRSPEWRSLQSHLIRSFNEDKVTVRMEECGDEDSVVVSGLSPNVLKCCQQVSDFLEKNAAIETQIALQSAALVKFLWEERKEDMEKIQRNVRVTKNLRGIRLCGPRLRVQEAAETLRDVLQLLHCDTLTIEKPGAKKFCETNAEMHVSSARTAFRCAIQLEEVGVADANPSARPQYQRRLGGGVTLCVYKGDLCRHNVDVIVNAANEDLQHVGGLAKAMATAAGRQLQEQSDAIISRDGKLLPGDSVITDAGKLPCKQVIHTVGPRWDPKSHLRCQRLLRRAISTSLQLACDNKHTSIAIPAVSSGIFGFPLKLCVETIMEAIRDFAETPEPRGTLQRIHLVDTNEQTVSIFSEVAKDKFGSPAGRTPASPRVAENPEGRGSEGNDHTVRTKEGLRIKLVQKNIEDCSTDVIVNSTGVQLDLSVGAVSQALQNRAGSSMQQLLNDESQGAQVAFGSVLRTDGCNLTCQEVLHVVTPQWDGGHGTSEKALRAIITKCLALADQNRRTSISFPAIGTGNLGFPKVLVASVMFDEILRFSRKTKVENLQEVHVVLHPSDKDSIRAFTSQLASCTDDATIGATKRQAAATGSALFGTVTNPSLGVHEMKIGSVTYEVKTGDITKEDAEIIVNSSNENFTLCTGVSQAILDAAGQNVASSAADQGSQPHKGLVLTSPGNLPQCRWILHVSGPKHPASIKKIVLSVLQECETQGVGSVAFPAIGTGAGKMAASTAADAILEGLVDFIRSKSSRSLQRVKVVLFQQQMLNDFYGSMKRREGTPIPEAKSLITRLTEFFLPQKAARPRQKLSAFHLSAGIEPVVFSLCAADAGGVARTKEWLQQQIEREQAEKVIREDCICDLEEAELSNISDLQKKFQVSVAYRPSDPTILIRGLTRDVLLVSGEIESIISRLKDRKNKERAAELTHHLVEWTYDHGGAMVAFDKMTNLELEEARNDQKAQIPILIRGVQYTAHIRAETATDNSGLQIQIQRVVKNEGDWLALPKHWQAMGQTLVQEVTVAAGTPEYSNVQQAFQRSAGRTILQILRVQNKDLWQNYQIKKQNLDTKNGSANNEKELFHGTDVGSVQHVSHSGFNRSYAGKNGTAIGNGTYFAVNAHYSVSYATTDVNGRRHMYLARVLTGLYCAGRQGMITPPAKNPANPTELYDSVTDNVQNPSMFVIFNDIQAYPEYHIIFQ